jgi:pimeloyl-ACP methyl ester carboxylesterase
MAADLADVTVQEETTDDAIAAIDLLRTTPRIDPARVYLAGHSLGGYLAPRIAARVPGRLAGIALLEANSSPLGQLIIDQYEYLASEAGGADPQAAAALDAVRAQVALAESSSLSPSTPASDLPLGVPGAYWLDLRTYDPLATVAGLSVPIFVSQGGRDYQVPPSELAAWRKALSGRDDVTIHEYPALNHLLMPGSGPSTPAEYAVPGHVAPELVKDLAAWVLAGRP